MAKYDEHLTIEESTAYYGYTHIETPDYGSVNVMKTNQRTQLKRVDSRCVKSKMNAFKPYFMKGKLY